MNNKTLAALIIFFSLISGFFGAYFLLSLNGPGYLDENGKEKTKTITKTITDLSELENNITDISKNISPSVVSIIIKKDLIVYKTDPRGFFQQPVGSVNQKVGGGSGFFVTKDGKIITNKHVVSDKEANYTVIDNNGDEYDASVIAIDPLSDLAIIKISADKEFTPLKFAASKKQLNVGQFAIAIGNALSEFQNSVSLGIVSGKNRKLKDGNATLADLIQTDAAINPGNSGGPLVNLSSEVIGINTAIINGSEGIGFAIAMDQKRINYILSSIEKYGVIKKPFIGIYYELVTEELKQKNSLNSHYGAYILNAQEAVFENSGADLADIKPGEIILDIDGDKITLNNDLKDIIQTKIPGDKIKLNIMRADGTTIIKEITLGEY